MGRRMTDLQYVIAIAIGCSLIADTIGTSWTLGPGLCLVLMAHHTWGLVKDKPPFRVEGKLPTKPAPTSPPNKR